MTGTKISASLHEVLVSIFNVCPVNLKVVCIHPAHMCLSRCLQDGLLYCLNSCVSSNAANLCHSTGLLLSKDATDCVHFSEINTGILYFTQHTFSLSLSVQNRSILKSTSAKS